MADEFNLALCEERHRNLKERVMNVEKDVTTVANQMREDVGALHGKIDESSIKHDKQMNKFQWLLICTLVGILATLIKGLL